MIGRTDLEDGIKTLDKLTNEEVAMASAQLLRVTHNIDNNVMKIDENVLVVKSEVELVKDNVQAVEHKVQTMADGTQRLFDESSASFLTSVTQMEGPRQMK